MLYPKSTGGHNMFKKLTLKNDFHNTEANFRVQHNGKIEVNDIIHLSAGQVKKAKRILCWDDCTCSAELGTRAEYHEIDGLEVKISEDIKYNNMGELLGASLCIERIW